MVAVALTTAGDQSTYPSTAHNTPTAQPVVLDKPANLADLDYLLAFDSNKNASGTNTPPSGFASVTSYTGATPIRTNSVYGKPITAGTVGSEPSSYSFTSTSGTSRYAGLACRVTGVNLTTPVDATGAGSNVSSGTTLAAPAVTAVAANALLFSVWQINVAGLTIPTYTAPAGQTLVGAVTSQDAASTTVLLVFQEQLSTSGSTGTRTLTYSNSAAVANGFMFTLNPGAVTAVTGAVSAVAVTAPPGSIASTSTTITGAVALITAAAPSGFITTPVTKWLANTPLYVAHRGADNDWVEETAYAYSQCVPYEPRLAIEISVWLTSDGVWVCSHDQNTSRVFGTSVDIPSNPYSALTGLATTVGGYPMARLVDLLNLYATGDQVIYVDNKQDANATTFLNLLDSYGGASRFVVKGYYTQTSTPTAALARGYQTWGYYFTADLGNLASSQSRWTQLGLEYNATGPNWATVLAYGKPTLAHSGTTTANNTSGLATGATGLMTGKVVGTVPATGFTGPPPTVTVAAPAGTVSVTVTGAVTNTAVVAPAGTVTTAAVVVGVPAAVTVTALVGTMATAMAGPAAGVGVAAPTGGFSRTFTGPPAVVAVGALPGTMGSSLTVNGPAAPTAVAAPSGTFTNPSGVTGPAASVTLIALSGTFTNPTIITGITSTVTATAPSGTFTNPSGVTGPAASVTLIALSGTFTNPTIITGITSTVTATAPSGTLGTATAITGTTATVTVTATQGGFGAQALTGVTACLTVTASPGTIIGQAHDIVVTATSGPAVTTTGSAQQLVTVSR